LQLLVLGKQQLQLQRRMTVGPRRVVSAVERLDGAGRRAACPAVPSCPHRVSRFDFDTDGSRDDKIMERLPDLLKIPDRFFPIPITPDEYRLYCLSHSLVLRSPSPDLLPRLLPLLDGGHPTGEIVGALRLFGEDEVRQTLNRLLKAGLLEDAGPTGEPALSPADAERYRHQMTFFSHFTIPPEADVPSSDLEMPRTAAGYQEALRRASVVVYGLGRLGSQLVRLLALSGIGRIVGLDDGVVGPLETYSDAWYSREHQGRPRSEVLRGLVQAVNPGVDFTSHDGVPRSPEGLSELLDGSTLAVLCTDLFHPEVYEAFNLACLRSSTTWTSCRLSGFEFLIGPTVIPRKTACYTCFDLRQKSNLTDYEEYLILENHLRSNTIDPGALLITPGVGVAALEVVKAISHFMEPSTYSHLFAMNLLSMECRRHPILKIPRCPHCGRPARDRPTIQIWQKTRPEE
jgi:bacteriocin biosynthesis cyclodehydratase domain-containing protein